MYVRSSMSVGAAHIDLMDPLFLVPENTPLPVVGHYFPFWGLFFFVSRLHSIICTLKISSSPLPLVVQVSPQCMRRLFRWPVNAQQRLCNSACTPSDKCEEKYDWLNVLVQHEDFPKNSIFCVLEMVCVVCSHDHRLNRCECD